MWRIAYAFQDLTVEALRVGASLRQGEPLGLTS